MCGIAGYVTERSPPPERRHLREMARVLAHRGPDGEGFHTESHEGPEVHVGLAHRRLAVIDVEGGRQPMAADGRRIWIVYNGEVYNFEEIRADLEREGARFRTRSDTEVVLELYRRRGVEMLASLRGMFSFAIWDGPMRTLFLARDRLGQKPLVYFHSGRRFAFASEIKALLELPWVPREPALEMLPAYLLYQYVPSPGSFFRGIRKLPPAHYLLWRNGRVRVERYWDVRFAGDSATPRWGAAERIRHAIDEATRIRLRSDVPLGSFLSGGIDSSIITSSMARASDGPVKSFSVGFDRAEFDETRPARCVSRRLGTDHRESRVRPDALAILPKLLWHFDEPFGDSSAIPTYYLARETRGHVTVALSGDGGDELFGGYDRYRAFLAAVLSERHLPAGVRRGLAHLGRILPQGPDSPAIARRAARLLAGARSDPIRQYIGWAGVFSPRQIAALLRDGVPEWRGVDPSAYLMERWDGQGGGDPVHRIMEVDLRTYLPEDLLVKVDITTMACSLECRSPFLDHRLVEEAARIPREWKVGLGHSKGILREAFAGRLPRRILRRKKMGFGVPIGEWFRGESGAFLDEFLAGPEARSRGLLRTSEVVRLIREHRSGAVSHAHRLWCLLVLETWLRELNGDRHHFVSP